MTNSSDRLDRIESILDNLVQRQDQSTRRAIDEVAGLIESLAPNFDALSAHVNAYIAQSTACLATQQRDRAEFRQQMLELQTETRNILRELADQRCQQRNGHEE
jgi:ABC-type transporter Mla subunit MlaD